MPDNFKDFDITPDRASHLSEKMEGLCDKLDDIQDQIDTLTENQALELAVYMESIVKVQMDPAMIAQLLEHRISIIKSH